MNLDLKKFAEFFREEGANDIGHSDITYLAHAMGVYRDLKFWGCDEELCHMAIFHSIYGTESFQGYTLPLDRRGEIQSFIGERAERLAYLNCALTYESFDRNFKEGAMSYNFFDRFKNEEVELSPNDFEDLCRVHLCDRLEQAGRSMDWDWRRETFEGMAEFLGGVAKESYDRVYAEEMEVKK